MNLKFNLINKIKYDRIWLLRRGARVMLDLLEVMIGWLLAMLDSLPCGPVIPHMYY